MGIFNSKNLKKAVNMVASSSPVINAISQATDIVDKSMDVIDKNLNGGKTGTSRRHQRTKWLKPL